MTESNSVTRHSSDTDQQDAVVTDLIQFILDMLSKPSRYEPYEDLNSGTDRNHCRDPSGEGLCCSPALYFYSGTPLEQLWMTQLETHLSIWYWYLMQRLRLSSCNWPTSWSLPRGRTSVICRRAELRAVVSIVLYMTASLFETRYMNIWHSNNVVRVHPMDSVFHPLVSIMEQLLRGGNVTDSVILRWIVPMITKMWTLSLNWDEFPFKLNSVSSVKSKRPNTTAPLQHPVQQQQVTLALALAFNVNQ